jgi:hypothetical protein
MSYLALVLALVSAVLWFASGSGVTTEAVIYGLSPVRSPRMQRLSMVALAASVVAQVLASR